MNQFRKDLMIGKEAEQLVKEVFEASTKEYQFEDVSNIPKFYYRGDIKATRLSDGKEFYIEVKNDSRIHETYNVLCEEEVYYKESDYYGRGNMSAACDYYVVVSQASRKIYVLDFKILRSVYRRGEYKVINHPTQTTYCYLCNIGSLKRNGALLEVLEY